MSDTSTPSQVAATLTDEQLTEIVALAPVEPIQAIINVWRTICPEWDTATPGTVKPWSYSLPRSQWSTIGHALGQYHGPGHGLLEGANLLLDWMNKGPSVREDDA